MTTNTVAAAQTRSGVAVTLLRAMRVRQWIKNFFIFFPIVFSQHLLEPETFYVGGLTFGAFCLCSSAIYLINDLFDRTSDQQHPIKRHRPIASGLIRPVQALTLAILLLVTGGVTAYAASSSIATVLLIYVALNLAYSAFLRHVPLFDVLWIAVGFLLRVWAGGLVIGIPPTHWALLTTLTLTLFLGFGKRFSEVRLLGAQGANHRQVLLHYNPEFLMITMGVLATMAVVFYSLYTISEYAIENLGSDRLVLTVPFVLYGILRYLYLVLAQHSTDDPTSIVYRDRSLVYCVLLWATFSVYLIYFYP